MNIGNQNTGDRYYSNNWCWDTLRPSYKVFEPVVIELIKKYLDKVEILGGIDLNDGMGNSWAYITSILIAMNHKNGEPSEAVAFCHADRLPRSSRTKTKEYDEAIKVILIILTAYGYIKKFSDSSCLDIAVLDVMKKYQMDCDNKLKNGIFYIADSCQWTCSGKYYVVK